MKNVTSFELTTIFGGQLDDYMNDRAQCQWTEVLVKSSANSCQIDLEKCIIAIRENNQGKNPEEDFKKALNCVSTHTICMRKVEKEDFCKYPLAGSILNFNPMAEEVRI